MQDHNDVYTESATVLGIAELEILTDYSVTNFVQIILLTLDDALV